jgi:hypothetical protein
MTEHDRLAGAPVLEVDLRSILHGNRAGSSFGGGGTHGVLLSRPQLSTIVGIRTSRHGGLFSYCFRLDNQYHTNGRKHHFALMRGSVHPLRMHTSRIRKERHIAGTTLDADAIMARATPQTHQDGHDPQPYGHQVAMPIALSAG